MVFYGLLPGFSTFFSPGSPTSTRWPCRKSVAALCAPATRTAWTVPCPSDCRCCWSTARSGWRMRWGEEEEEKYFSFFVAICWNFVDFLLFFLVFDFFYWLFLGFGGGKGENDVAFVWLFITISCGGWFVLGVGVICWLFCFFCCFFFFFFFFGGQVIYFHWVAEDEFCCFWRDYVWSDIQ